MVFFVFIWFVSSCTLSVSASRTLKYNYVEEKSDIKPDYCNYTIIPGDSKKNTVIRIYNSYEFRNQYDIEEILRHIINTDTGKICGLSDDDIPRYVAEWLTHNFAYYNPSLASTVLGIPVEEIISSSQHSDLNLSDPYSDLYWLYYQTIYQ